MRITTVSYKKIFPTAPYVNLTIGVEIQVDAGEVAEDALDLAKQTVEEWYLADKSVEEIKQREEIAKIPVAHKSDGYFGPRPKPDEINRNDEKIEIAIDNAQTIEELNALSKNLPVHLMTTFVNKLTELKNK